MKMCRGVKARSLPEEIGERFIQARSALSDDGYYEFAMVSLRRSVIELAVECNLSFDEIRKVLDDLEAIMEEDEAASTVTTA